MSIKLYDAYVKQGRRWVRIGHCALPKKQAEKWTLPRYPGTTLRRVIGSSTVWGKRTA